MMTMMMITFSDSSLTVKANLSCDAVRNAYEVRNANIASQEHVIPLTPPLVTVSGKS